MAVKGLSRERQAREREIERERERITHGLTHHELTPFLRYVATSVAPPRAPLTPCHTVVIFRVLLLLFFVWGGGVFEYQHLSMASSGDEP